MAGKRQHEIPRFLTQGFASRIVRKTSKEDSTFVWVFRKGSEPFECNTINVGVEGQFYNDGVVNVDDEITELEEAFVHSVNQARELGDGSKISDETLFEFIDNLTTRTKHLRDSVIDIGEFAVDRILGRFSNYESFRAYFIELLNNRRDLLMKPLEEKLNQTSISEPEKALLRTVFENAPVEAFFKLLDDDGQGIAAQIKAIHEHTAQGLNQMVKQAHVQHLKKDLISEKRVSYFQQLRWFVRRLSEPLILGDVCCLFRMSNQRYVSIGGPADEIDRVILPLAKHCILVGTREDQVPQISVSEINEASAKVSRNYFISSVHSTEMIRLSELIDTEAEMLTQAEKEDILTEVWAESLKPDNQN